MRRRLAVLAILTVAMTLAPASVFAEPLPYRVRTEIVDLAPRMSASASDAIGMSTTEWESPAITAHGVFDMVGVTWDGPTNEGHHVDDTEAGIGQPDRGADHDHDAGAADAEVWARTARNGIWSPWANLTEETDLPDPNTAEAANQTSGAGPAYMGAFDQIQVRWSSGDPRRSNPRLHLIDVKGHGASLLERAGSILGGALRPNPARASSPMPPVVTRAGWGADESMRRADPGYGIVRAALVHHTVNPNGYSCSDSAAIVRGIYSFHVNGNGWNDIGYNALVDACGTIFEGRFGGLDRPVIGAHSGGSNSQTTGVALIGTFTSAGVPGAMYNGLVTWLDWKLDVHGVNPLWHSSYVTSDGVPLNIRNVSGHRDAYPTSCPGDGAYAILNSLAGDAYNRGGQKIFSPQSSSPQIEWNGSSFGTVEIFGWLKLDGAWAIRIYDSAGGEVRSYSGSGNFASATWDGRAASGQFVLEGGYTWKIESGDARPAFGGIWVVGGHRFEEWLLAYNPGTAAADLTITLMNNSGVVAEPVINVPPKARRTVNVNGIAPWQELSARATSNQPVLMERAMYFNYQGSMDDGSASFGSPDPANDWYFAEGYTGPGFFEYLTLLNPNPTETIATIRYLFNPSGVQTQNVTLAPNARTTVNVNGVVGPDKEVAAHVSSPDPIVVERPQYYIFRGQKGGDNVMGAKQLSTEWNFAEGYTGGGFTTYLTMANPGSTDAIANIVFFGNNGVIGNINRVVKAGGRSTVTVNDIIGTGHEVSTKITSNRPIVAERPVYFGYHGNRNGGHVALGATSAQTHFDFAEGYTGPGFDEYLTVLNPISTPLNLAVTYAFPANPPLVRNLVVPGNTRMTVSVHDDVARAGDVSVSLDGSHPFNAERPMYFTYRGAWRGGHNVQGGPGPSTSWYFAEGYTG